MEEGKDLKYDDLKAAVSANLTQQMLVVCTAVGIDQPTNRPTDQPTNRPTDQTSTYSISSNVSCSLTTTASVWTA